jgi:Carbohydrate-binding module 48 (Isoamylase N-terminal domain)
MSNFLLIGAFMRTLGEHDTQVLPDRCVTFRLLAPQANDVKVLIGLKGGVYEPEAITTTEMTKQGDGFWTVTLGPFDPNLYEYQFNVDGLEIPEAIETAIVHLGYFSWVGAFSPFSPTWVFSDEFKNALKSRTKSMRICVYSRSLPVRTII